MNAEELKSALAYDAEMGVFSWKVSPSSFVRVGSRAGNINPVSGYETIKFKGRNYKCHRLAWLFTYGAFPAKHVDHINGVKHDNRIVNLREASYSENQQNLKKCTARNTTGYLGVSYRKSMGKYVAMIKYDGKNRHLGLFNTAEEASKAYLEAKRKHHPFNTM